MTEFMMSVLVADRHVLDSELIATGLTGSAGLRDVRPALAADLRGADRVAADLVLVDGECPEDLFERVCQAAPAVGLLYDEVSWQLRERSRRAGVVLTVSRRSPAVEVVPRLEAVVRDGVRHVDVARRPDSAAPRLSRRETEVLHLMARGLRNQDIAGDLRISPHTVRTHVQSVLAKLGSTSRVAAVGAARQAGLLPS